MFGWECRAAAVCHFHGEERAAPAVEQAEQSDDTVLLMRQRSEPVSLRPDPTIECPRARRRASPNARVLAVVSSCRHPPRTRMMSNEGVPGHGCSEPARRHQRRGGDCRQTVPTTMLAAAHAPWRSPPSTEAVTMTGSSTTADQHLALTSVVASASRRLSAPTQPNGSTTFPPSSIGDPTRRRLRHWKGQRVTTRWSVPATGM